MFKTKIMKHTAFLSFLLLMSMLSCTKAEHKPLERKLEQKIKADTVITKSTILLLGPDEQEIEEIKKKQGEDNFYTIADDANYYSAEIFEAVPATIYSGYKIIDFPKENYVFDKNKSEDKWLVIDYKPGSKPKVYSLVDYYRHITEK
ncbi:hypothetical protein [Chryseobacterium sp. StRB126]|uniref:hypothetical protein n=1 Tax=Chryseobacterium sp. StRB126 TaxID=878220 RepID=UPI000AB86E52|nr:hypothetical protein [Chryseobacterium sp. StRB126]